MNIGDRVKIKEEYQKDYGLIPRCGNIQSIDGNWITIKTFMGELHVPKDRITFML